MLRFVLMKKVKPILMLWALLFASLGGCYGPLMAAMRPMPCCASMPCAPANHSRKCCTPELSGVANHLQQTAQVTAPAVAFAVMALIPRLNAVPVPAITAHMPFGLHYYSPPGGLYTIHDSFLI